MTCGIYILYYETDDFQYYVGKSIDIEDRYKRHCSALRRGTHKNIRLKEGFSKYGDPSLGVLEVLPYNNSILFSKEITWIAMFDSFHNGMNETLGGEGTGFGENNPVSLYTNQQIIDLVKYILANPHKTLRDVSSDLDISYFVIKGVVRGTNHTWLEEKMPEEYFKLLSMKGTRLLRPVGECTGVSRYSNEQIVRVLLLFLKGNTTHSIVLNTGVPKNIVNHILAGTAHTWLADTLPVEYTKMREIRNLNKLIPLIKSPDGTIYKVINRSLFATEHKLERTGLGRLLNGISVQYMGWTLA